MSQKFVYLAAVCVTLAVIGTAAAAETPNKVLFEYYHSITTGTAVANLRSAPNFPAKPDKTELRDSLKGPVNYADNFGTRARAYLTPPETGDYTFWIASDDSSELWLSSDDKAFSAKLIAWVSGNTSADQWTKYTTQKSAAIALTKGKRYYIEALQKDGTGGDNLSVGWAGPGIGNTTVVIAGTYLTAPDAAVLGTDPAFAPNPTNGATEINSPLFQWTVGKTAVMHEVYMGTNPTPGAKEFMGPWPVNMYFHIPGLTPGATYYWRVDEVDAAGNKYVGPVWSFAVQPLEAHLPSPFDGQLWRALTTKLTWTAGQGAVKHKVFLGTDRALVTAGDAKAMAGESATTDFTPANLTSNTQYYWRVDEVDSTGKVAAGPVWKFSTIDTAGGAVAEYWNNINLINNRIIALAGPPAVVTTVPSVNFAWADGTVKGTNSPDAAINTDYFAARYTALLNVPVTGAYTLYVGSDDGGRLFLNGTLIAGGWADRSETENASAVQNLEAGKQYVLVMEMYEAAGGAAARLRWSGPGITKEIIPPGALQIPKFATSPIPREGEVEVADNAVMSFTPGKGAVVHTLYFGTDQAKVTAGDQSLALPPTTDTKYVPAKALTRNTTYYWKVEEMAADGTSSTSPVWSFKTADWTVVQPAIVTGLLASKTLNYDNSKAPFLSQLAFDVPADLTAGSVTDLALRFSGLPVSFLDNGNNSFTIRAAGADIYNQTDEFRYVYKTLAGDGSITARVDSLTLTNAWVKAAVMIRESLNPVVKSVHACVSGSNGFEFQYRTAAGGSTTQFNTSGGTPKLPQWIRLTRKGNTFTGETSSDGTTWTKIVVGTSTSVQDLVMTGPVYIGMAVTSHVAGTLTTAEFSNVQVVGATGEWQEKAIAGSHATNSRLPLYVAIEDKAGKLALVTNPDPAAVNTAVLDLWRVPMSAFKGVDLKNAVKLYVGVGDGKAGGTGTMTFADIRIVKAVVSPAATATDITAPGDPLVGLPNDGVGSDAIGGWPAAEVPANAIDNDVTKKFLHFKGDAEPTGFAVTPKLGATVVTGLTFTTANDEAPRDPITWELYGSNKGDNGPWEVIAKGTIDDFGRPQDWPRRWKTVTPIGFANGVPFLTYKVMFPTVKKATNGAAATPNSMQIAEVELLGVAALVAPPANPVITNVVRSKGQSDTRDPIGKYDGETAPLPMGLGGLQDGNMVFSDRTYPWSKTPKELAGAEYVRTFNSDKNTGEKDVTYTVTISRPATVALTCDDRFSGQQALVDAIVAAFAKPGQFKNTGLKLYIRENATTDRPMSVFSADLPAGTYVFGGNDGGNNFHTIGAIGK